MVEATIVRPADPLKRIKDTFEHLRIKTTKVHHAYVPGKPRDHSELINAPMGSPIMKAEYESEIAALHGYLAGVRYAGWIQGIITISIGQDVSISGIIDVEEDQPEQMANLETMLNELNRRAALLVARNITAIVRCSFVPE